MCISFPFVLFVSVGFFSFFFNFLYVSLFFVFFGGGEIQVTLAHAHEANQRIVDQLNDHVDFLNRQLVAREAQLSKVGVVV